MGIHGLSEYLKKEAPEYVQEVDAVALGVRVVALDAHQWMVASTKKAMAEAYDRMQDPWADLSEANVETCLRGWLRQALLTCCFWMDLGMEPVWVFDGPSPVAKQAKKQERADQRAKAEQRLADLRAATPVAAGPWGVHAIPPDVRAKVVSYRQQMTSLQPGWQDALVALLGAVGVPWILGATEGEKVACMLHRDGLVDAVVSTDSDCLAYGCDRVIVQPKATKANGQVLMPFYALDYIREFLEMDQERFVEFCIACGCDYNTNIPQMGPARIHAVMKEHGGLASWPALHKRWVLDQTCLEVELCKRLFTPVPSDTVVARRSASLRVDWNAWQRSTDAVVAACGGGSATAYVLQSMNLYPR